MKRKIRRIVIVLIWLLLWQILAAAVDNRIVFVGPLETLRALLTQSVTLEFWRTILESFVRIAGGFLGGFLCGILAAALAALFRTLQEFLEPPVRMLQSVPVASFVILALIWIGSRNLAVLITAVVVFPVIYRNVLEGIEQADRKLLEMARVFRFSRRQKVWWIYRPSLMPYLLAGCRIALGLAWKSGAAAEVIGVPDHSIGEKLYMAKIYLDTAGLFAWTFVIIAVSRVFEGLFLRLLALLEPGQKRKVFRAPEPQICRASAAGSEKELQISRTADVCRTSAGDSEEAAPAAVQVRDLWKSYHGRAVLEQVNISLSAGGIYCLLGPSGQGKTTLLRILMGLEQPDAGAVRMSEPFRVGAVFQENRLCEYLDGVENIRIASGSRRRLTVSEAEDLLGLLLEPEALHRPVRELSGGMKRRVAIMRALASDAQILLMDEPFTGLDEGTREKTAAVIRKLQGNRTMLVVTHQEEDIRRLGAKVWRL